MPTETLAAAQVTPDLHVWEGGGAQSAEALSAWVSARLAAHEAALKALIAVKGPRTLENSLRLYDAAIEQLSLAGAQSGVLNSVAAEKAVRDQAQMEAQRVAMAGSALSLNREVYDALVAISLDGADSATKHYVERTLLGYRLAGVDKDEATRDRLKALHEKATRLSLEFSRNIQEGGKTIEATAAELEGLPADYLARHPADAKGKITLTTDPPDMQPVMTFAASAALRERMFLAYNTRAYPANKQILLDLLATRQEIATVLGFRSWADLATADQMMRSAANVRTFLARLTRPVSKVPAASTNSSSTTLRAASRAQRNRHHQPRLLVRAIPPRSVRLRLAIGTALFPLRAGRSRRAQNRGPALQNRIPPLNCRWVGSRSLSL